MNSENAHGVRSAATTTTTTLVVMAMVVVGDSSGEAGWVERTFNLSLRGSSWLEMRGMAHWRASSCSSTVGLVTSSRRSLHWDRDRRSRLRSISRMCAHFLWYEIVPRSSFFGGEQIFLRIPAMSLTDSDPPRYRAQIRKFHVYRAATWKATIKFSDEQTVISPVDNDDKF